MWVLAVENGCSCYSFINRPWVPLWCHIQQVHLSATRECDFLVLKLLIKMKLIQYSQVKGLKGLTNIAKCKAKNHHSVYLKCINFILCKWSLNTTDWKMRLGLQYYVDKFEKTSVSIEHFTWLPFASNPFNSQIGNWLSPIARKKSSYSQTVGSKLEINSRISFLHHAL